MGKKRQRKRRDIEQVEQEQVDVVLSKYSAHLHIKHFQGRASVIPNKKKEKNKKAGRWKRKFY